jgi:hypothetical protein
MSMRDELVVRLRSELGECVDPADVIDELMGFGGLDQKCLMRYLIAREYVTRFGQKALPAVSLLEEVADDFHVSTATVYRVLQKVKLCRA